MIKSNIFRRVLTISIFIVFLNLNIATSTSLLFEKTEKNSFDGNILFVGGYGPGNYSQIQDAIDDAKPGDTVFVYSGVYFANIVVDKSISLIGENQENTIIEDGSNGISIIADGVIVERFTIQNCGGFWHLCGVYVNSNNNRISNLTITNNEVLNGVFIEDAFNNTVSKNIITDNNYFGIRLEYASQNKIFKNLVSNVISDGIMISESSNNQIYENTFKQCSWNGIEINPNSFDNKIYHNNILNNSLGNALDAGNNIWDDNYPPGGNFWSDYDGEDADDDGIGDTPYIISGGENKDRYPLMKPFGAPEKPVITGPSNGKAGEKYEWTFTSVDTDNDDIYFWIEWGDKDTEQWIGPYESGEEAIIAHTFTKKGTYNIQVKAKDKYEAESSWGELSVTMPRIRIKDNLLFIQLLEKIPNVYLIIRLIFDYYF